MVIARTMAVCATIALSGMNQGDVVELVVEMADEATAVVGLEMGFLLLIRFVQ